MPDAAKLVAAICIGLLAFIVSGQVIPLLEEGTDIGYFVHVNVVLGLATGWIVMGKRAGRGVTSAINNGLSGAAVLLLWAVFVQACNEMVRLAMKNRYDGAFESIVAVFELSIEFLILVGTVQILSTLAIGGIIAGFLTEYAWRTWR